MSRTICTFLLALALPLAAAAQTGSSPLPNAPDANPTQANAPQAASADDPTLRNLPRNFFHDQAAIWTSPLRLNEHNALGPVVLVGATALLMTTDHQVMSKHFLTKSTNDHANTVSTGMTGLLVAAPAALFVAGSMKKNEQAQQTGVMAGEAMVDSLAVNEVFKIASRRERPTLDDARGKFFQPGVNFDSSFASNHCMVAWSSAAVIASEYNGFLTQVLAYGAATGVSLTRVAGRDHFPSDVLVGSAVGWMIGRYVYHRHHRYQF
jgi:hypothetical protein